MVQGPGTWLRPRQHGPALSAGGLASRGWRGWRARDPGAGSKDPTRRTGVAEVAGGGREESGFAP